MIAVLEANKVDDHVLVGQEQSRLLELLTQLQLKIDGVKVSNLISETDRMHPLCLCFQRFSTSN